MKVLLLGGTGVMGVALAELLNANHVDTFITSRSARKDYGTVKYIQGNAKDFTFLEGLCPKKHWDVIVDFMSYKTKEFEQRYELFLSSTNQYVFISTGRVYGNQEYPIKETSPRLLDCSKDSVFLNTDEYSLTKARQEDFLLNSSNKSFTIVRPCITYGNERLQLGVLEKEEWLFRCLHGREVVMCQEILDRTTTMTHGQDVAQALYNILGNDKCLGETYHLTCPYHRTWQQIAEIYDKTLRDITGKGLQMKIVGLEEFLSTRSKMLKYQVIYDRVYDKVFSTEKESTIIDVDSFIKPEEGLSESLINFIKNCRGFKYISPEYEARKDLLTGTFSTLFDIKGVKNKIKYSYYRFLK